MLSRKWLARLAWVAAFTLFSALSWAAGPYWTAKLRSAESGRGRQAHRQVAEDTWESFGGRALIGGAAGFLVSLLPMSARRDRSRRT
jgi:hypothetical protein